MAPGAHSRSITHGVGAAFSPGLPCQENGSTMKGRPRFVVATRGGDLTPRPVTEVQMPAIDGSRPQRLRHPIPPSHGARTYPGAPS